MKNWLAAVILAFMATAFSHRLEGQAATNHIDEALLQASTIGDTATVQRLLQEGANVEASDHFGNSALLLAASSGQIEVAKLLLEKHAKIEAKDKDSETALLLAPTGTSPKWQNCCSKRGEHRNSGQRRSHALALGGPVRLGRCGEVASRSRRRRPGHGQSW